MFNDSPTLGSDPGEPDDPELLGVHAQLMVFARELGELYHIERTRSAELEQVLTDLRETYLATMKTLAQVIEAKDRTTRGHLDRTKTYGVALAERIAPDLAASPELTYGFFLHDIGKVGVPEHILCKEGPLTDEEWTVMRTHPTVGAQIVAPIRFLGSAVDTIRHHHERYDGSGYPLGLKADEIPLAARIFAVADTFDAMTSDRPYRSALSTQRALDEIQVGIGSQFDPEVVAEFMALMRESPPSIGEQEPSAFAHAS
jgi:HD-GYP domain-containing protein (c-di-GMP phosphodiesterase class II)